MSGDRLQIAVAIVLRRPSSPGGSPRVLVGHRLPNVHLPDYWEFPGGKLEPGESSEACARREVLEETGVEVAVEGLLLRQRHDYPDRLVSIDFHVCRYLAGTPQPLHCQAVRWVDPANLEIYPFPNANEPVLRALADGGWLERVNPSR